jgi:hypothetical protein
MARYFFDFRDGEYVQDEIGVEASGYPDIKRIAGQHMADLLRSGHGRSWRGDDWSVVVRNEEGRIILVLTLVATETGE